MKILNHLHINTKKLFNVWYFLPLMSPQTPTSYWVTSK